ncbi:MAG: TolC family protein [Verrucomicrobiales bacterium]|nr:TolC family protein [Verrucomicrobiales bacterium]
MSALIWLGFSPLIHAADPFPASMNHIQTIDLATTLRLAGAQHLDIQIARERLLEARANHESTLWQFFPWLSPGLTYRRHDNLTQDVIGNIIDVHKESYTIGPTISAQLEVGDAIYRNLAARQLVNAADYALESQQQDSLLAASQAYFDLVKAHAAVVVANEAVRISTNYLEQVQRAAEAGIAFRGDVLRVEVQSERNRITARQAQEQERVASARLVQVLHLETNLELVANEKELIPLSLVPTNTPVQSLVSEALSRRPELKQNRALAEAARTAKNGALYGPLIPSVGAQVFVGGLGGGRDGVGRTFGESEDYQVMLGWRIGPGGVFDRSRIRASEARLRIAQITGQKLLDEITRQVIEHHTRSQSLADQLGTAQRAAQAAEEALRLSEERKQFAVGNVLETILAEQELTRARLDLSNAIAEYNKAQYSLLKALGSMSGPPETRSHGRN